MVRFARRLLMALRRAKPAAKAKRRRPFPGWVVPYLDLIADGIPKEVAANRAGITSGAVRAYRSRHEDFRALELAAMKRQHENDLAKLRATRSDDGPEFRS